MGRKDWDPRGTVKTILWTEGRLSTGRLVLTEEEVDLGTVEGRGRSGYEDGVTGTVN